MSATMGFNSDSDAVHVNRKLQSGVSERSQLAIEQAVHVMMQVLARAPPGSLL